MARSTEPRDQGYWPSVAPWAAALRAMRRSRAGCRLPATYVIHAVGPVWRSGERGEPNLLAGCYRRAFELASERRLKTIAFAAISCGVYGYPHDQAARIAVAETRHALAAGSSIETILFVCFDPRVKEAYETLLAHDPPP